MKGNFQVRFLEGRVPAMAPGYSTVSLEIKIRKRGSGKPLVHNPVAVLVAVGLTIRGEIWRVWTLAILTSE
jgi:hypothetical protein